MLSMLQRLVKLRMPITIVLSDSKVSKSLDQALNLSTTECNLVKCLSNLLEPFWGVMDSFSSAKNVSVSTILPMMFGLQDECMEDVTDSPFLTKVKVKL